MRIDYLRSSTESASFPGQDQIRQENRQVLLARHRHTFRQTAALTGAAR
jgi:hypothetical protein